MERYLIIPDLQIPYHDAPMVKAFTQFTKDYQPDQLLCVGDEADSPEPSRWNKGTAGEFAGTLQKGLDKTHEVISDFRDAIGDKPFHIMRSNHGDRIQNYVRKYAPALDSLRSLEYETLLGYHQLGINFHHNIYKFAPGWGMAHGDEGSLIGTSGGTALNLAKRTGLSIVCGHTHRLGIQHHHTAYSGKINGRLYGVEVGHMMDLKKAGYLKSGGANWQAGFAIMYVDKNKRVTPSVIPVNGRSFTVEGKQYSW